MAKFIFRLEPVLRLKIQKEESIKNELGKAIQKLESEKRKLERLKITREEIIDEFNLKTKKTTVRSLIEFNNFLSHLNFKIKQQKERVNKASLIVDKIREELVKAVQERKILENLKEKKHEEYLTEQKRLEHKTNDEIVSYKHKGSSSGD